MTPAQVDGIVKHSAAYAQYESRSEIRNQPRSEHDEYDALDSLVAQSCKPAQKTKSDDGASQTILYDTSVADLVTNAGLANTVGRQLLSDDLLTEVKFIRSSFVPVLVTYAGGKVSKLEFR